MCSKVGSGSCFFSLRSDSDPVFSLRSDLDSVYFSKFGSGYVFGPGQRIFYRRMLAVYEEMAAMKIQEIEEDYLRRFMEYIEYKRNFLPESRNLCSVIFLF